MSSPIIENEQIKQKCQIFTPENIVHRMLDMAGYQDDLFGKKILENAAGNGEILIQIVQRYIASCEKSGISRQKIKKGLETDIAAYEIDENRVKECKERLDEITQKHNISKVHWNIQCSDYLQLNNDEKYNFIIGNPPYIAYPDLPCEIRTFVKNNFSSCEKGKFDYCYAFIEKSLLSLAQNGILVYIIPSNIFKNVFANKLRNLIIGDLHTIIDFPTEEVFEHVLVSPAIIKIAMGSNSETIKYFSGDSERLIKKKDLGTKWNFSITNEQKERRLGDYFNVSSSVATLLNCAFVIRNGVFKGKYYCLNDKKIEKALLRKAASPKNKKYLKYEEYIIFPYFYDKNGKVVHYSEKEMLEKFPMAMDYLQTHKEALLARDADAKAQWFEYGRSQALSNLNQQVVMISSVISSCTQAYLLDKGEIPYSGLYIIPRKDMPLSALIPILNSDDFRAYINSIGVCVSGTSKRITPSDIENYTFSVDAQ